MMNSICPHSGQISPCYRWPTTGPFDSSSLNAASPSSCTPRRHPCGKLNFIDTYQSRTTASFAECTGDGAAAQFTCAFGKVQSPSGQSFDAANCRFLSGAAGLILLSGMFRLQHGELPGERHNYWSICFRDARRASRAGRWQCRPMCGVNLSLPPVRVKIHRDGRWSSVESGGSCPPPESKRQERPLSPAEDQG